MVAWLLIMLTFLIFWFETSRRERCRKLIEKRENIKKAIETNLTLASFTYDNVNIEGGEDWNVVGESFYTNNLKAITARLDQEHEGKRWVVGELIRDPENEFDKNAVRVVIAGLQVAHIEKKQAKKISEALLLWEKLCGQV